MLARLYERYRADPPAADSRGLTESPGWGLALGRGRVWVWETVVGVLVGVGARTGVGSGLGVGKMADGGPAVGSGVGLLVGVGALAVRRGRHRGT